MGRPPKSNLPKELAELLATIAGNLKAQREKKAMSQAELARQSKVSISTVNEIETKAYRDIRISTLSALAQKLDIPIVALFLESDLEMAQPSDRAKLLKASETILQITNKLRPRENKEG